MASSTPIGTYRSMTRRPPRSAETSRNEGSSPRITTSRAGNPMIQNRVNGSRRNSRDSAFRTAVEADTSGLPLVGEVEEGVVERGVGDAEPVRGDPVARQQGDDGVDGGVAAVDGDQLALPADGPDVGQRRQV